MDMCEPATVGTPSAFKVALALELPPMKACAWDPCSPKSIPDEAWQNRKRLTRVWYQFLAPSGDISSCHLGKETKFGDLVPLSGG